MSIGRLSGFPMRWILTGTDLRVGICVIGNLDVCRISKTIRHP